jgi:hypothetical protein
MHWFVTMTNVSPGLVIAQTKLLYQYACKQLYLCGNECRAIISLCDLFSEHLSRALMMEAVRTSETSVDNHFTRQYNPEDSSEHHIH